jgi:ribosomal protein S12 methylthiotransferase accessory factor YcaO
MPAIRVDIRSAGGDRPAVVVFPAVPALAERLARAGFAVISFDGEPSDGLAIVVAALARGELAFTATAIGLLGSGTAGAAAAEQVATQAGVSWLAVSDAPDAADQAVRWCGLHLAC